MTKNDDHRLNQAGAEAWESWWSGPSTASEALSGESERVALQTRWLDFFARAGVRKGAKALDIACGASPIAKAVREKWGDEAPDFFGTDVSAAALAGSQNSAEFVAAGNAAHLPFDDDSFEFVVSQFGAEYGGARAFAEAARVISPKGRFAAVAHLRGGEIEKECAANARALDRFGETGLLGAVRAALKASFAPSISRRPEERLDPSAEERLSAAAKLAESVIQSAEDGSARDLLARYYNDLGRLSERRFAFEPEEAFNWLDQVEAELRHFAVRMRTMVTAALGEDDIALIRQALAQEGLTAFRAEPIALKKNHLPAAWWIEAKAE
ncbi:MAG: methyltransferase domain-containing protein [Alphaproteobacteria bacterium]|nr:methyltransferase domain-containing protein [Alphaproteobacteria bacterium]